MLEDDNRPVVEAAERERQRSENQWVDRCLDCGRHALELRVAVPTGEVHGDLVVFRVREILRNDGDQLDPEGEKDDAHAGQ